MLVQHRHNDAGNSFGSLWLPLSLSLCLSLGTWSRARCARSAAKNPNKNNPEPSSALPSPRIRVTCKIGARCSLCSARLGSAYVLILHVQRGVCVLLWRSNSAATLGADAALLDCLEYICLVGSGCVLLGFSTRVFRALLSLALPALLLPATPPPPPALLLAIWPPA